MVEVFKTNVVDVEVAGKLISILHHHLIDHHANFDLEDCDRILRIENQEDTMNVDLIVCLLEEHGFQAAVLEDNLV